MDVVIYIGYLGLVLLLGSIVAKISESLTIPDIPLLLILGLLLGPGLNIISPELAQEMFEYIGPIGLIFILLGGSFTMRISHLSKVIDNIIRLDTITLIITLLISGLVFNLVFGLNILNPAGYLFGAVTCATDPATLIPVFSRVKINPNIAIILEAESVFNDPLGIVATTLILGILGLTIMLNPILNLLSLAVGAIVVGYIMARIYKVIIVHYEFHEYVAPLVLGGAMLLVYLGEYLLPHYIKYGISGYMAVAIMAIFLGDYLHKLGEKEEDYQYIVRFSDDLSLLSRIFIFVFLGACIRLSYLEKFFVPGLILALASIFIARPLGTFIGLIKTKHTFGEKLYIALEGPRGVVPAALAVTVSILILKHADKLTKFVPNPKNYAIAILVGTFMTILISVILEASWAGFLAKKLLNKGKNY